jgi:hypothetical protein
MRFRELLVAVTPTSVPGDGALIKVARGKSAIKRAAILGGSGCAVSASGSAAINEVNALGRRFFREASQLGGFQPGIDAEARQHCKDTEQHSISVLTHRRE